MADDAYFNSENAIAEYERHEPANAGYNLDLLSYCGISPAGFRGRKVLDIGCGFGLTLQRMVEHGAVGFGIDVSEVAIKRCRDKTPHIRAEVADFALRNPFDEKFSLITCFGTLGLVKKEAHERFLRNVTDALEEGALFFANAPNLQRPTWMDRLTGRRRSASYTNARTAMEWKGLLDGAGLRKAEVFPVLKVPGSAGMLGRNAFIRIGSGDPLAMTAKK